MLLLASVLGYAPPVQVEKSQVYVPEVRGLPVNGVSADCSTSHLEVDCQVTGLPVIDNIGFDAGIDTSALEVNVDILYDGKKYSIYHLSAHNPELCIDEIVVAKVCAKVENLEWSGGEVSGTLYVGVGVVIVGTKYFKVTDFDFDYDEDEEAAATEAKALDDAKSPNLFGCNTKYTDCTSCVEATEVLIYPCYWCEIDNACHDVGSIESACSPPSADDKCVSLSSLSNCAHKDVGECPTTAAKAKALDDDANSVCSICEEAVKGLIAAGAGGACGAACAATGCEPCVPFCASICGAIASGETNAEAICADVDLC